MMLASSCGGRPPFTVFIGGTGTGVGKTVVTAALLRALRESRLAAQAVKCVQTGMEPARAYTDPGADAAVYAAAVASLPDFSGLPAGNVLHCFALPASPHLAAAREGRSLDVSGLCRDIREYRASVAGKADILLLETAGGLRVPLNEGEDMLDLVASLAFPVLLVAENALGTLNHTLLSLDALQGRGVPLAALILVAAGHPRDEAEAAILADNPRILRRRMCRAGITAPLMELPRISPLSADAWGRLALMLSPLAGELAAARLPAGGSPAEQLVSRDRKVLWHPYASATESFPLHAAVATRGNRIILADGQELIDGMSSWWAAIHGYNHPRLLGALYDQAARMPHVMFGGLTHEPAIRLGERLLARLPEGLEHVFFADSGSVAVEVAMKMAVQFQQNIGQVRRKRFLSPLGGYHGDTFGAMSVCDPVTGMHQSFAGFLPQQLFMERPSCRFDEDFDAGSLDEAARILEQHGAEVAAVILEPVVQGAGGMWFYHPEYLRGLAALCREAGCLLILDEIATGFGRTGRFFAAEWADARPDILCLGKALTGGVLSLAATACTRRVAEGICREGGVLMHGPTFMGNALACAVANASLDLMEKGDWAAQVGNLATALRQGLAPCRGLAGVADVRVLGGIGVVETETPVNAAALQDFFVSRGVWIRPFSRLVYLMPPYVSPAADVAALCAAIEEALRRGVHLP